MFSQTLPIAREVGDRGEEGVILNSIGKPEEALKFFNQALPISREVGNPSLEKTILENIEAARKALANQKKP